MNFSEVKILFTDSCSLIILEKSGLISFLKKNFTVYTISEVKEETLKKPKIKNQQRYNILEEFFQNIFFYNDKIESTNLPVDKKLFLALEHFKKYQADIKVAMLTDDKKIIKRLYKKEHFFINALLIPAVLYHREIISLSAAKSYMNIIKENSRYSKEVIRYAENILSSSRALKIDQL